MNILSKIFHWGLDLLFPKYCLGCGLADFYICPSCLNSIPVLKSINCHVCGRRSPTAHTCPQCRQKTRSLLAGLMVAADWNNLLLRQIIYEYKYRFVQELSIPLSYLMTVFLQRIDFVKIFKSSNVDLILIPVPLHGRRLAWRGFNQAELLAQKIATHFNSTLINDILIRSRHALPQMDIKDQNERKENIKTAFAISKKYNFEKNNFLKDKIVILIDDISTTGSTLEECAKTLKPLKPKEIWGLVIARG